jgi:hypothetical protein
MPDAPNPIAAPAITGSVFVAAGEDGARLFSRDGRTWTSRVAGKEGEVYSTAAFGGGRCAVVGRYGGLNIFAATQDGAAWQVGKHDAKYANYIRCVTHFRDKFLGFGQTFVMTSADGITWGAEKTIAEYKKQYGLGGFLRRFAFGEKTLVGVGDFGRLSVSQDGLEWTNSPECKATNTLIDVAYGNGFFVGGGMHGLRMRSVDGLTWTDRQVGEEGEHINTMVWNGKQFVGIGQGATYLSPDGLKWERVPNQSAPTAAAFGGGAYVGALYSGRLLHSTDGIRWEQVHAEPQHIIALAHGVMGTS